MKLNAGQQEVVDHDGHSLVVACPGSGKTRVIVIKIGRILTSNPKARVCAVTFTRDAANELKSRLVESISADIVNRRSKVGTFHSLAIRQLRARNHINKIASPAEQSMLVNRAIGAIEDPLTYEEAVLIIETVKSSQTSVPEEKHPLYLAYAEQLRKSGVEDLYDVLKKSLKLMQSGEVEPYQVEYMLVDEFQDTDEIQLAWVLEHAKRGTKITVVGDDDQSVYSFRRALGYKGMEQFRVATDAKLIALGTNYRCRSEILSSAKDLITCNQERIDKSLVAARGPGGSIASMRFADRIAEADAICDQIKPFVLPYSNHPNFTFTTRPGQWAVLARNRRVLDAVEEALSKNHIKYVRAASESIWNRPPFIYFLGILKSIQTGDAHGVTSLLHWIGLSYDQIDHIHNACGNEVYRLMEGFVPDMSNFQPEVAKVVRSFITVSSGWRRLAKIGHLKPVIAGVSAWFQDRIKDDDQKELFTQVASSIERMKGSLAQRANALASPPSDSSEDKPSGVALMTMHGSKGLEFDHVWIVASEATVIPSPKNPVYDEERRLMYVAMTRAKDHLYFSSRIADEPSPFVIEAGHDPRKPPK